MDDLRSSHTPCSLHELFISEFTIPSSNRRVFFTYSGPGRSKARLAIQQCLKRRHYGLAIREIDTRRASNSSRSTGLLLAAAFHFPRACLDETPLRQSKYSLFKTDQGEEELTREYTSGKCRIQNLGHSLICNQSLCATKVDRHLRLLATIEPR